MTNIDCRQRYRPSNRTIKQREFGERSSCRVIGQSDRQDAAIVWRIQNNWTGIAQQNLNSKRGVFDTDENNIENILLIGQTVKINNHLRNEYNTVGKVTRNLSCIVKILNPESGHRYKRAWWNL